MNFVDMLAKSEKREIWRTIWFVFQCLQWLITNPLINYKLGEMEVVVSDTRLQHHAVVTPSKLSSDIEKIPVLFLAPCKRLFLTGATERRQNYLDYELISSWARHFTLTLPLSTRCRAPANLILGVTLTSHPGGVEILLVASCYRNRDKPRPDGIFIYDIVQKFGFHARCSIKDLDEVI